MKIIYKKLLIFYTVSFIYLILHVGKAILFNMPPEWVVDYFFPLVYGSYAITCCFVIFVTIYVYNFSKVEKTNILAEIMVIDIPALLALSYMFWKRWLFNLIDFKYSLIRSYIADENTRMILLILGSVMAGIEIIRYRQYLKSKK